jgi:hypothetical protein
MNRIFLTLLLISLLTACAPAPTPLPDTPVNSGPPRPGDPVSPKIDDTIPRPADKALYRGTVYLNSIDLLTLESYPLQFSLALTGNLPTPCNHLRVAVSPPDAKNKIAVNVYSVADPNAVCIQMLEPFDVNIPLGSFPSGHYTLWVNREQVAEFDA